MTPILKTKQPQLLRLVFTGTGGDGFVCFFVLPPSGVTNFPMVMAQIFWAIPEGIMLDTYAKRGQSIP